VIGKTIAHYKVTAKLGAGGMGEVYRATDTRLGREVAIKMLPPELAHNMEFRRRFGHEARTISNLSHPHICTLYDIGRQDDRDYLVMEYLEGESLSARVARGQLPLQEALRVAREKMTSGAYDLIVLDEIIYAIDYAGVQLVTVEDVLGLIDAKPPSLHLILTGRNAPQALIDRADLVTEMQEIKHPWQQKVPAQQGIDY